jgi:hypothetical protein
MERTVYLWIVGETVIHHTDLAAAAELDGLTRQPDKTIPEEQFYAARGLARLIDGEIFLGKTATEKQAERDRARIRVLKRQLADTDYIAVKIAEGSATKSEYATQIAERRAWRTEINELEQHPGVAGEQAIA